MLKIFSIFNNIVKLGIILDVPTLLTEINTNKAQLWSTEPLQHCEGGWGHSEFKVSWLNRRVSARRLVPVVVVWWTPDTSGRRYRSPIRLG